MTTHTPNVADRAVLVKKQTRFLSAPKFAVVGASDDASKFGAKVFSHLRGQQKDVVPININETHVQGIRCLKSLSELPDPTHTAVSIVVPPSATLNVLKQAKALGIFALWLQPGAEDAACVQYIKDSGMDNVTIYSSSSGSTLDPRTGPICYGTGAILYPSIINDLAVNVTLAGSPQQKRKVPRRPPGRG
ncbi:CoA binding domain-containing protein [Mycena sp. CBHHK59/15]|nr:CoA binding domain-containing protein [Mycena sp. CBHHK59/15]